MALDMAKFLARFVQEARDHVEKLNEGLVRLEKDPEDAELTNAVFRSAHTIKGSARMMKLAPISEVAHRLEDCLGAVREKRIHYSRELADLLFKGVDAISGMIENTAAGQEIVMDNAGLCEELMKAAEGQPPAAEKKGGPTSSGAPVTSAPAGAPDTAARHKAQEMPSESVRINAEK